MELISIGIISAIGFVVAVLASMVGGAALIMVPILVFFGIPIHTAIGTNWVADGFMSLTSSVKFYKDDYLKIRKILPFSVIAAISGILGISILLNIDENLISRIISVIIIIMALFLLVRNNIGIKRKLKKANSLLVVIISVSLGIYGGFFGGGLGSLLMMSLIFIYGFDFISAVANARFVEFLMGVVIVIGFISRGLIHKQVAIPYALAAGLGGWVGASIAPKIGNIWIKRLFIFAAIIMGIKLWAG